MNIECNKNYTNLCDKTSEILSMLKFLNYAYNLPNSDFEYPMGNEEKTGGQFFFFYVMDELEKLDTDIQELLKSSKGVKI